MSDYHLHLHPHGYTGPIDPSYPEGIVQQFVDAAAKRGVTELGFTEHLSRCVESKEALGIFWQDEPPHIFAANQQMMDWDVTLSLESYVETVLQAKNQGLPVKLGLEVDFFPETIDAVMELLKPYPFDHLIGSVHWIGGLAVDSPWGADEMRLRGTETCWNQYFELVEQLAGSGVVDVLAHVDVVKKYLGRSNPEPVDWYRRIAKAAQMGGTAVEVSSAGLKSAAKQEYPSPAFLKIFQEYGVPITLASDAHLPKDAGLGNDHVVAAAKDAGYSNHLRFSQRESWEVPLK